MFHTDVERGERVKTFVRDAGPGGIEKVLLRAKRLMTNKVRRGYAPCGDTSCFIVECTPRPIHYKPKLLNFPCYAQPIVCGKKFTFRPGVGLKLENGSSEEPALLAMISHLPALEGLQQNTGRVVIVDLLTDSDWESKTSALNKLARELPQGSLTAAPVRRLDNLQDADEAHQDFINLGWAGTRYYNLDGAHLDRPNICKTPFKIVSHKHDRGGVVWVCESHGKPFECKLGGPTLRKIQLTHAPYFYGRMLVVRHMGWHADLPVDPKGVEFG